MATEFDFIIYDSWGAKKYFLLILSGEKRTFFSFLGLVEFLILIYDYNIMLWILHK